MNRQTGKEMHNNLVKYYVYRQLKADDHRENLSMTTPHFNEREKRVHDSLRDLENGY